MNKVVNGVCGVGIAVIVAGCATTANYEKNLNSWVGANVDRLVSVWGIPQATYPMSNGGKILQYSYNSRIPGYTYTTPQTSYQSGNLNLYGSNGGSANGIYNGTTTTWVQNRSPDVQLSCVVRFAVDASGYIRQWNWQGNNCRS